MGSKAASFDGYYRFPTLSQTDIVFVSEDDLWTVPIAGGTARRLTSGLGRVSSCALSRDGRWIAFSSSEEGHSEIFIMPSVGGEFSRRTFLGCDTRVLGWNPSGEVIFASNHQQAFSRLTDVYALETAFNQIRKIPCGPATHYDVDEKGRAIIARHGGTDLAFWKRYRGGRAGQLWIDHGARGFEQLLKIQTNTARPFWVDERIVFISDHDGIGQVYSVAPDGSDLRQLTHHREFFVRGLSVSGRRLVYHAGGDLFTLELDAQGVIKTPSRRVHFDYLSPRTQTQRRFVSAVSYLQDYELDPSGEKAVITARGKTFSLDPWRGPIASHGQDGPTREKFGRFLKDGKRIVLVSDAGGEESLEIHDLGDRAKIERLEGLGLGRTRDLKLSPTADEALVLNHRSELIWVDLNTKVSKVLDRSLYSPIRGFNWSNDGRFIAYNCSIDPRRSAIKIYELEKNQIHVVTSPLLADSQPIFDPDGEYLYFISHREFDPVYDNMHFDLSFPRGSRPYLLTLRKDVLPPFHPDHPGRGKERKKSDDKDAPPKLVIDFDGIENRIVAFPLPDGRYAQIAATSEKLYFTRLTIKGSLRDGWQSSEPPTDAQLETFDLESEKTEMLLSSLTSFRLSKDGKQMMYRHGNSLRLVKSTEKPNRDSDDYRRGGWLDLNRVQIAIAPRTEWRQIFREAWRLQRDHFWTEDMSKVDWQRVFERYAPLLDRVNSRWEVSDLIWEMQGELGTSHAYEIGGDYRDDPHYGVGFLGCETEYDKSSESYRLTRVLRGDPWDEAASSPLARAGIGLQPGDSLIAIDGRKLSRTYQPCQALLHRAGQQIALTYRRAGSEQTETRAVRALRSEQTLRYREWVEGHRRWVHEKSKGRVGYVHIPNMGPAGYAEFHRSFLTELDREGLIVDVRFNGGGHVSSLLLEKLARRRIGYCQSRWFGVSPYPEESPTGPMVALTNEHAGSDGDIFSHSFKLLKLGPLLGKRTWGGVIGISPSENLVDGATTTQPEYSFWFADVGWRVENYGTEPDFEVEFPPEAYATGRDPQLEAALKACELEIERKSGLKPTEIGVGPDLSLPQWEPVENPDP